MRDYHRNSPLEYLPSNPVDEDGLRDEPFEDGLPAQLVKSKATSDKK